MKPSISTLRGLRGGLVVAPAAKSSLMQSQFMASSVVSSLSLICLVSLSLWHLLLGFYMYGGVDPVGVFTLFLKKVEDIVTPKHSIIFLKLIRLRSFPECWRSANVTAIPKGTPSPDRENYLPISLTPIMSKVYEKLVSHKLSSF